MKNWILGTLELLQSPLVDLLAYLMSIIHHCLEHVGMGINYLVILRFNEFQLVYFRLLFLYLNIVHHVVSRTRKLWLSVLILFSMLLESMTCVSF